MRYEWRPRYLLQTPETIGNEGIAFVEGGDGDEDLYLERHMASERQMADEILRLARLNIALAQKAALLDEVSSALDDGRLFMPNRDPGRTSAEALVDKIRALYRPKAKKE